MRKAPALTNKIIINSIRKAVKSKGYAFFERGDLNLNIIGIRNARGGADSFDDALIICFKSRGEWKVHSYEITTEPGPRILKRPINKKGTAILVPGQYRGVYKIGTHKTYTALCQRAGPVKVWRDNNRDSIADYDCAVDEGRFGINIHKHRGSDMREDTGGVSAGCQVFRSSKDFKRFMTLCAESAKLYGNSFTYTLITSDEV